MGKKLGGGGEGTVYAVAGRPDDVAKIYNGTMSAERRTKIEAMITSAPVDIKPVTAWPSALILHGRDAVGFIMPRVANASEAHVLYGLKSRRQTYPNANFRFLVHVAANLARAFSVLHQAGIVVGDVNERVAMIATDGTVRIIDCDSFQYKSGTTLFGCDVGTPIFTPPELQKLTTFRGVERTAQHDLFGLAVLIFHLLFLGRHPFAGRCLHTTDMPIETAIQQYRFAYSADNGRTQMQPPPHTPPLGYSGGQLTALFEQAFSPAVASGQRLRPSARQWADTLAAFLSQLTPCKLNTSHAYVPANGPCPWCAIELTTRIDLFNYVEPADGSTREYIDYEAIWRAIDGLAPFRAAPAPDPSHLKAGLKPGPGTLSVLKGRAEQDAISKAQRIVSERKSALAQDEEAVERAESLASAAHAHADAFESDGLHLLKLQEDVTKAQTANARYKLFEILLTASALPAMVLASLPLQNANVAIIPGAAIVFTILALSKRRTELQRKATKLTEEMHTLRLSIDLGPNHRNQLAAQADEALAAARDRHKSLQTQLDAAMLAEQYALQAATVAEPSIEAALAEVKSRHAALQRQGAAFAAKSANLEADLTRGWTDILERKRNAQAVCHHIRSIEASRSAARHKAHHDARQAQLNAYLDQFFINRESWPRIPKSTLAALASYGIETAADINEQDVRAVPGFGEVRTGFLLHWRRQKEIGFRFHPAKAGHSSQLQQEERRLTAERRQHERDLVRIKAQIHAVKQGLEHRIADYEREARDVAKQMAQVLIDSEALRLGLPALSLATPPVQARASAPFLSKPPHAQPAWPSTTVPAYGRTWKPRKHRKKRKPKSTWRRRP